MSSTASSDSRMSMSRNSGKSAAAFRTISEVAGELEVPQHVLRFWETKFSQVRPLKRAGGRRYYRPEDVQVLRRIQNLLHSEGYTIKGVQRLLREEGRYAGNGAAEGARDGTPGKSPSLNGAADGAAQAGQAGAPQHLASQARRELESVLGDLQSLRDLLREDESQGDG